MDISLASELLYNTFVSMIVILHENVEIKHLILAHSEVHLKVISDVIFFFKYYVFIFVSQTDVNIFFLDNFRFEYNINIGIL